MIKFSDMPYTRPDIESMKQAFSAATEKVLNAKSYAEVREAFFEVQEKGAELFTLYSIASVRNT
ncbi:MAG: M3 family oligoendopeptidase, partial [Lachnospiraceae bacterium]|nr:M3 family oligoendopeptidase [Lachnospiraceae bacterium]